MIRRPRRTVPAVVVAVLLFAIAVLVTWSCVQVVLGRTPVVPFAALASAGASLSGSSVAVLAGGGVLAVLGLVLLVAAATPGRPTVLALAARPDPAAPPTSWDDMDRVAPGPGRLDAGATRRSVTRALTAAVTAVDGIDRATVTLSGRTLTAAAHTAFHSGPLLTEQVRDAVTTRLDDIGLARPLRVRVRATDSRST